MDIGIDQIGFYTPNKYLDMADLAQARHQPEAKFRVGIGQDKMAVADETVDVVSMAINATLEYFDQIDRARLGLLIVGTESGVDQSKSASLFVKEALNLPNDIRTFEVKEACFGATAGLMIARDYIIANPSKTAIVIGSDIARYGLNTAGEVTQGAGAISMLVSAQPRILNLLSHSSSYSEDINDFWRPNNFKTALVDGKYSTEIYLRFFQETFAAYQKMKKMTVTDFDALVYHIPFTKMGLKANRLALEGLSSDEAEPLEKSFQASTVYAREVGNLYTGSLYLALLSLLENGQLTAGATVGLYSYGSGAMAEFFAGQLVSGYEKQLRTVAHQDLLASRRGLSITEYETIFTTSLQDQAADTNLTSDEQKGRYYYAGNDHFARQYSVLH